MRHTFLFWWWWSHSLFQNSASAGPALPSWRSWSSALWLRYTPREHSSAQKLNLISLTCVTRKIFEAQLPLEVQESPRTLIFRHPPASSLGSQSASLTSCLLHFPGSWEAQVSACCSRCRNFLPGG